MISKDFVKTLKSNVDKISENMKEGVNNMITSSVNQSEVLNKKPLSIENKIDYNNYLKKDNSEEKEVYEITVKNDEGEIIKLNLWKDKYIAERNIKRIFDEYKQLSSSLYIEVNPKIEMLEIDNSIYYIINYDNFYFDNKGITKFYKYKKEDNFSYNTAIEYVRTETRTENYINHLIGNPNKLDDLFFKFRFLGFIPGMSQKTGLNLLKKYYAKKEYLKNRKLGIPEDEFKDVRNYLDNSVSNNINGRYTILFLSLLTFLNISLPFFMSLIFSTLMINIFSFLLLENLDYKNRTGLYATSRGLVNWKKYKPHFKLTKKEVSINTSENVITNLIKEESKLPDIIKNKVVAIEKILSDSMNLSNLKVEEKVLVEKVKEQIEEILISYQAIPHDLRDVENNGKTALNIIVEQLDFIENKVNNLNKNKIKEQLNDLEKTTDYLKNILFKEDTKDFVINSDATFNKEEKDNSEFKFEINKKELVVKSNNLS